MTISARIQERVLEYLGDQKNHSVQEIKNYLAGTHIGDYTEGQFAGSINTMVRNGSIKKIERGVYSINIRSDKMKQCFVVSPIGEEGSAIRSNADKLFKYILKPVCEKCDFEAIRVDQINDADSIMQTIIKHLEEADLVIADVSGCNPNVFYEIGYRARTKKPIIHLKTKEERLPFDINTIRTLEYDLTDLDSVEEIKRRLVKTIKSFNYVDIEENSECEEPENTQSSIMPLLYQILDSISELKSEVKNVNSETIGTVIKSMQNSQPQVSPDTALQMQLIGSVMNNPETLLKLIELSEKLPSSNK